MNDSASKVRRAVQAGRFYPADPSELRDRVHHFLADARPSPVSDPKAIIAPHAGYAYSGPVAGSAFAPWARLGDTIRRVVLLGPSHWVDFRGVALPDAEAFATPLGDVALDSEAVGLVAQLPGVVTYDTAHTPEHCLEVELPFLQVLLPSFTIVPLVVGRETDGRVANLITSLWGNDETRFILSSDLSHYLDYTSAQRFDHGTADSIQRGAAGELTPRRACGYRPIRAFLDVANSRGLRAVAVDLRSSGDTAGRDREVVGYGAFHFGATPPTTAPESPAASESTPVADAPASDLPAAAEP